MPIGGASTVGEIGYVGAAAELAAQVDEAAGTTGGPGLMVVADGSGGTHAGLVAGIGDHGRVLGVDVGARPDLDDQVPAKAVDVATHLGLAPPSGALQIDHDCFGAGYGARTDACLEALQLAARLEGLILDPVYTGKALAGLVAGRRDGRIGAATVTVFMHTGGLPALFATGFPQWIRDGSRSR
jgi:1-aminocyclopropane-1-carboxylate deaminase/D-cysteine desulfhydrase-like pyridoxal-dependent ACC family enzyme